MNWSLRRKPTGTGACPHPQECFARRTWDLPLDFRLPTGSHRVKQAILFPHVSVRLGMAIIAGVVPGASAEHLARKCLTRLDQIAKISGHA